MQTKLFINSNEHLRYSGNSLAVGDNVNNFRIHNNTQMSKRDSTKFGDKTPQGTNVSTIQCRGLDNIIRVHRLAGISYLSESLPPNESVNFALRLLAIPCNLAAITLSLYVFYTSVGDQAETFSDDNDKISTTTAMLDVKNKTTKSVSSPETFLGRPTLSPLVIYIRFAGLLFYYIGSPIISLYMSLISGQLLRFVRNEVSPLVPAKIEHRLGTHIVRMQCVIVFPLTIVLQVLIYLNFGAIHCVRWLENVCNLFALSSPIVTLAYVSAIMAAAIERRASLVESRDASSLCAHNRLLAALGFVVERVTALLAPAIILVIFCATIIIISCATLLIADFRSTFHVSIIGLIDYSTTLISLVIAASYAFDRAHSVTCRIVRQAAIGANIILDHDNRNHFASKSDKIFINNNNIESPHLHLHHHYPHHLRYRSTKTSGTDDQTALASEMLIAEQLQRMLCISPFGLFSLTRQFAISFFAFVLSYAVILIQTSATEETTTQH